MSIDIRNNLRAVISDKGYIQAVIANKAKISPSKLSQILNKSRRLEANELFSICDAIEMSPNNLRHYIKEDAKTDDNFLRKEVV